MRATTWHIRKGRGNYLAKRAAREAKEAPAQPQPQKRKINILQTDMGSALQTGGFRVTKQFDPESKQRSLLFQVKHSLSHLSILWILYPEIEDNTKPRHRFMSSYEQRKETLDKRRRYLLFAAEPYEIISFKLQLYFKPKSNKLPPPPAANGLTAPGALPRPMPLPSQAPTPPPQELPPGSVPPPPPPMMDNGPRSMPPGGVPPPPPFGSGQMLNFTPGNQRPPPPPPNFPRHQMQGQPPPPPHSIIPRPMSLLLLKLRSLFAV